ncbi:MAG: hypothetical protein ACTHLY_20510, partial [Pseudolabrys sp.]
LAAPLQNADDAPGIASDLAPQAEPDDSFDDADLFEPLIEVPATEAEVQVEAPSLLPAAPTVTAGELTELFFTAEPHERRLVLIHLDAIAATDPKPVNGDIEIVRRLEASALRHDRIGFAHELTGALKLAPAMAQRIVDDDTGEPLLVVARILRMPAAILQRMLLFLNPQVGHSVQRVYELAALYDEISEPAAHHLLWIWQEAQTQALASSLQPTLHDTVLWNDTATSARQAATPQPHKTTQKLTTDARNLLTDFPPPSRIGVG